MQACRKLTELPQLVDFEILAVPSFLYIPLHDLS